MKKRLFTAFLPILCLALCIPAYGANEAESGALSDTLSWTLNTDGVLTIEGDGEIPEEMRAKELPWYDSREKIERVFLRGNITSINTNIFATSKNLEVIVVDSTNSRYSTLDGVLFNADCTELICYPQSKNSEYYAVPANVTRIANDAFHKNTYIKSIDIPDGLLSIGASAFSYCMKLTDISIPDTVTEIGSYAFQFCYNLKTISIPDNVTEISYMAFSNCQNLESISIPASVTVIEDGAFEKCEKLKSISLPAGVTNINYAAFADCESLKSVHIPATVTKIGSDAFARCSSLREIHYGGTEEEWQQIDIHSSNEAYIYAATIQYAEADQQPTQDLQLPQPPSESTSNIKEAAQDKLTSIPSVKESNRVSPIAIIVIIIAALCATGLVVLKMKRKK